MRTISLVFIAAILPLTVNASAIFQRDLAADIRNCADDLTLIRSLVSSSAEGLNYWALTDSEVSYIGALRQDTQRLVMTVRKATKSCCSPNVNSLTDDDKKYFFSEASTLVNKAEGITSALVKSYRKNMAAGHSVYFFKVGNELRQSAPILERCLAERTPIEKKGQTTALSSKLKTALDKTIELIPSITLKNDFADKRYGAFHL